MRKKYAAFSLLLASGLVLSSVQPVYAAGWALNNNDYYYYNSDGSKKTGWYQTAPNSWYYFDNSGKMVTGLREVTLGCTYYFSPDKKTLGLMYTGWRQIDRDWYYFNSNKSEGGLGLMHKGWLTKNGTYYLDNSGKLVTGLYSVDVSHTFYFHTDSANYGKLYTGWLQLNKEWYYFDPKVKDGFMGLKHTGWLETKPGEKYYFDSDGKMKTGWLQLGPDEKYYFNSDGRMKTGWLQVGPGEKYYFDSNGLLQK